MQTDVKENKSELTKKDFVSDQSVRWCPGCGDYMILANMQKAFARMGHEKQNFVNVSGIGCSSRITYYLDTYGVHSIHGRALAVATGVKLANPGLNVWVFTGDGDCMAIGGNHFIHACRRNLDMNVVIFNNRIYGMTKGQSSPTTPSGLKTKTAPEGSIENPFNIGDIAIGSGATFFARVPDNNHQLMEEVMMQAYHHKGTSVIEVLQNCVIFTDGIHEQITGNDTKDDNQLLLEHGKPMIYGKEQKFGLKVNGMRLDAVPLNGNTPESAGVLVHDAHDGSSQMHAALVKLQLPEFPVAMGVIRKVDAPQYEQDAHKAIERARSKTEFKSVNDLFHSGNTWDIG
ncbi:MAG: 2-oxoacid:ferredoxin oxidoreductase subunit beta [Cyclonatronaceae bacterium]